MDNQEAASRVQPQSAHWSRHRPQRQGLLTLPCCQLGLGRQRQQCGLAAANRAAASWRANRLNERRSTNVEWNVQCRLTGEHFEKIIVGNGHFAGRDELLVYGVELERRKADCGSCPHVPFAGIEGSSVVANGIGGIAIHIELVILHRLAIVTLQEGLV